MPHSAFYSFVRRGARLLRAWGRWTAHRIRSVPREAAFWTAGLVAIASIDPQASGPTLCLLEHLGLPCPGEGLGRAIAHLARGEFAASWAAHPLAGPVAMGLLARVAQLCRRPPRRSSTLLSTPPTADVQSPPASP